MTPMVTATLLMIVILLIIVLSFKHDQARLERKVDQVLEEIEQLRVIRRRDG